MVNPGTTRTVSAGRSAAWVRDLILVSVVALVTRTAAAVVLDQAPWTDSAYYYASANSLATGQGLRVPFLWSFLETGGELPPEPSLPVPSHAHWLPLAAMISATPMALLEPSWRVAQIPMVLLSTALSPLSYLIAMELWRSRFVAIVGALLLIFTGPLLLFGSIVENFAVFGLAGSLVLYASIRSVASPERSGRWLVLSGGLVGVAALARIDGLLLAVAPAVAWLAGSRTSGHASGRSRRDWRVAIGAGLAFALAVAPWAARNLATFGQLLPSTSGKTLFIKSYNEQFSITADTSIAAYFAQGPAEIVWPKIESSLTVAGYTVGLLAGVFGVAYVAALVVHWRRREFRPFIVYFVAMFLMMGGVFTFHAPHGLFYHHAAAWLPIAAPMSVAGVAPLATWASRWWRFLRRPQVHRFVAAAALAAAVPFSLAASGVRLVEWRTNLDAVRAVDAFLDRSGGRTDVVMYRDAPLLTANTGWRAIAPPADPFPVIGEVARAFGVRWYVAQLQAVGPAVEPLGLWEGGRSLDANGNRANWLEPDPAFERPGLRIYRVVPP